ncbi:DNA repair protein RadC [Saccharicrinis carchari]|uniref:DNA repair protein RadC n=1 Tax=Saccharicrinis carchari TaxID=1168039 RepID=A0A521EXX8_SACCC|nr:JAB domain-containing protein [Saccharicrinis carchari]SMO88794.1 DNA repair protein RadC [Saccharicrinis carchari]
MNEYNFPQVELKYVLDSKPIYKINGPSDICRYARSLYDGDTISHREFFFVIFLNRSNHISGYYKASEGGISGTVVDVRTIFQAALLSQASGCIITHNHPSGNLEPSQQDMAITNKIKAAAKMLDIALLDHIIVNAFDEYYSFANEGAL